MSEQKKLKPFPVFETDDEVEKFVDEADLSEFDLSNFKPAHFVFASKDAQIQVLLPERLMAAVKEKAKARGVSYTRYIYDVLQNDIAK